MSNDGSSVHTKALAAFADSATNTAAIAVLNTTRTLGQTDVAVDHDDAAGTELLTAPAGIDLAVLAYVECTENVTGATFQLGIVGDPDLYDDGTKHALYDAATESFVHGFELEAGEVLIATPTVAGTTGAYKYTLIAQAKA